MISPRRSLSAPCSESEPRGSPAPRAAPRGEVSQREDRRLEEMLRVIPSTRGPTTCRPTQVAHREAQEGRAARGGEGRFSYIIPREGAARWAWPAAHSGKSSLVRALTHATPAVGDYPFHDPRTPSGMMPFEDIAFQLVDLPPSPHQHVEPWSRPHPSRRLVWAVIDGSGPLEGFDEMRRVLEARTSACIGRTEPRYLHGAVQKKALVVVNGLDKPASPTRSRCWRSCSRANGAWWESRPDREPASQPGQADVRGVRIMRVYTKQPGKRATTRRLSRCRSGPRSAISRSGSTGPAAP